jgi:hypothetical protein
MSLVHLTVTLARPAGLGALLLMYSSKQLPHTPPLRNSFDLKAER